jgi:cell division protein FtsA
MQNAIIAAVDFGSKKLSVSLGILGEEEVNIIESFCLPTVGMEKGFITNEFKCQKVLTKLLESIQSSTQEKIHNIYAGISSRGLRTTEISSAITLKDGKVTRNAIKKATEKGSRKATLIEGEEIVDVVINFFTIDGKVMYEDVNGWIGNTLEVNLTIIMGPIDELDKFRKVIKDSGYNLKGFIVNILAAKKVFLQGRNALETRVLIDIGGGVTDIAVFNNGVLKNLGNIPVGGNNITRDISICGKYSLGEAENIKTICSSNYESIYEDDTQEELVEVGTSKVQKTLLYQVTKARIEEMLKIANEELKKSSYYQGICSIIIFGDGLSCFQNIDLLTDKEFEKKTKIITKDYLGMKNSSSITSLAIVKEVFDRMSLLKEDITKIEVETINEQDSIGKSRDGIINKFKSFLSEIF